MIFNVTEKVIKGLIDFVRQDDQPLDRPFFKYRTEYYSLDIDLHSWMLDSNIKYEIHYVPDVIEIEFGWNIIIPKKSDAVLFKLTWL